MAGTAPILSLSHVTLRYEHGITALDDVSLEVHEGERICVLGPNGSGKSTLASVFCGLLAPDEGSVTLVGERVFGSDGVDFDAYRRARRQIGLVFQNPDDQIVTSVVEEDVAFGPENLGVAPEEIDTRVQRELHRVALDRYAKADPAHLSGGQKQRVAIAGALAMEPRVLVLDEPGSLLDVRGRRGIMGVMAQLHEAGTTVVHVTHFMEEALEADRVVVLASGRIVLEGKPAEVFSHADELRSLGLEEPFAGRLSKELRAQGLKVPWTCDEGELIDILAEQLTNGHKTRPDTHPSTEATPAKRAADAASQGSAIVRATSLGYTYGETDAREERHPALHDLSFSLVRGSSTAVIGQTGSGKSTLLRLLCALEAPDEGMLTIGGTDTSTRRNRRMLHGRVGYVMQHPERQLFAETVWQDVAYGPTNLRLSSEEISRRVTDALALVGLTGREEASPFHLSGGQQRLCALAGILAMEPQFLVLDEPTAGLDPHGRRQLRAIINDVNAHGVTIVEVTHSMDDAAAADEVMVLSNGRLLMQGSPREVFSTSNGELLCQAGLGLPQPLVLAINLTAMTGADLGEPLSIDELACTLAQAHGEVTAHGV